MFYFFFYLIMNNINIILATTLKGEIGINNTIPWRLKGDLNRFKQLTMGHIVIMGRKTYESLPKRLEGRKTYVISETKAKEHGNGNSPHNHTCFFKDLTSALAFINDWKLTEKVFIAGGAKLYLEALNLPSIIYLTTVYKQPTNPELGYDTILPPFDIIDTHELGTDGVEAVFEMNSETGVVEVSHTYAIYYPCKIPY